MRAETIAVEIIAASIYEHSVVTVRFTAETEFRASVSGEVISVRRGIRAGHLFQSQVKDGVHGIELEVIGIFRETRIPTTEPVADAQGETAHKQYGMRFYPLVSSRVIADIKAEVLPVGHVTIELPDAYRLIWRLANVTAPDGTRAARLRHGYGPEKSRYVFSWNDVLDGGYKLAVGVRLGGPALLRIAQFPIFYAWLSLFIVAVASFAESITVLLAATGAAWLFMLQQWNSSALPQRSTLLTRLYAWEGIVVAVWGAVWRLSSWAGVALIIPTGVVSIILLRALAHFDHNGRLPPRIERYWHRQVAKRTVAQRDRTTNPPAA
jgi:hypothetical protein